jgi:hypothetical protein
MRFPVWGATLSTVTNARYAMLIAHGARGSRVGPPTVVSWRRNGNCSPRRSCMTRWAAASSEASRSILSTPPGSAHLPAYGASARRVSRTCNVPSMGLITAISSRVNGIA